MFSSTVREGGESLCILSFINLFIAEEMRMTSVMHCCYSIIFIFGGMLDAPFIHLFGYLLNL